MRKFTAILCCSVVLCAAAVAQAQTIPLQAPTTFVHTPIPEGDVPTLVKTMGLIESDKPVREMVKDWRKPKKVIVFSDNNTNRIAWLQEVAPGVKLVPVYTHEQAMKEIVDADAQLSGFCNKDVVQAGKLLHWVHANHGGVEECFGGTVPADLTNGKVVVTNLKRVLGATIADHAIAMTMALSRGLDQYVRMNQQGHFDRRAVSPEKLWEIQGKTLLVVGLGGVGTDVAKLAHAIGMKVIATRATSHEGPDYVDYVGLANELPDLVGKADVVVICSPLTADTTNMFNAALFARMKKGALLINVARGGEVVTADLEAALKSGQVGGAGLDVTQPSQLPDNDPLYNMPNVILTPHMAAQASDADDAVGGEQTWQMARENLRRYVNGDKLYSVVDPVRGY